jgi:hypothetical protein
VFEFAKAEVTLTAKQAADFVSPFDMIYVERIGWRSADLTTASTGCHSQFVIHLG